MYFFTLSRITKRYYSFTVLALLNLINIIDCSNPIGSRIVGHYQRYPVVCDKSYRTKYFPPELQNGRYTDFGSVEGFPEAIEWDPNNGQRPRYELDYDSEFMSVGYGSNEFLQHNKDESTGFMTFRDKLSDDKKDVLTNFGIAECILSEPKQEFDIEEDKKSKRRYFFNTDDNEDIEKLKWHKTLKNITKKSYLLSRKSKSKFEIEENISAKPYTMLDTFSSMYNARRDFPKKFHNNLRQAAWSEDNCKSMRRIVGGYTVESAEELPYMVFVDTGCGGAIIGDKWVLTAGHCVDEDDPMYIHTGSINLLGGCQYSVVYLYVHPRFSRECLQYDIALLKISPSFTYSPAIKPIRMSKSKVRRKTCGIVAGWGSDTYRGSPRFKLMMTILPIVSKKKCRVYRLKPGQFCAGYQDASSDACQGDSGGPIVINGKIAGIVSYGYKCATPRLPGVYVDISYHRKWVRNITGI